MKSKYFYGYNIVAAGFIVQAVSVGAMFTFGVFLNQFQAEFGWSRAAISGASSLAFLMMGFVAIIAGRLNDRFGPKILIVASGISMGLGFLLMSRLQALWQLYLLYGLLVGAGFSTHDVITLSTVARWFVKRRGMMSGIVKVGTGAGQLLVPLMAGMLIAAYGWRNTYLFVGSFVLLIFIAVSRLFSRDPQGMGLQPDGQTHASGGDVNGLREESTPFRTAVRTSQFWIICVAEFIIFFCLVTIVVHIVPHAMDLELAQPTAVGVLSTIGGVSMLGRFVLGMASDKIGGKRSLIVCFILLLCGLFWLQAASKPWMLFLFAVIYGLAHGGFFTVISPTVAELFGTGSHGALFGIVLASGALGAAVGPVMTGRVFDIAGSYRFAFLVLFLLAATGFLLIMFLRPQRKSEKGQGSRLKGQRIEIEKLRRSG